jgi:hypothetical protein
MSPNLQELMSITEIDLNDDLSNKAVVSVMSNGPSSTSDVSRSNLHSLFAKCFAQFIGLEVIVFTEGKRGIMVNYT